MSNSAASKSRLLIIFYRNPQAGKVKTRIAAVAGSLKALDIYLFLAEHTRKVTQDLAVDKVVYYSDVIDNGDNWSSDIYEKRIQSGESLGERMRNAFYEGFQGSYHSICIIGTDCLELESHVLSDAFEELTSSDAVIGPAKDGGYYLLGMNNLHEELFINKSWGTNSVYNSTIENFNHLGLKYHALPILNDVDKITDLPDGLIDFT